MKNIVQQIDRLAERATEPLIPLLLLFTRLWVAWVFFNAGLIKYASWDSTLYLFEFEYQVPLLPWKWAAYLGTGAELILPAFLALGLLTRPAALALFAFNAIAVVSYPLLWERGFFDHQLWGMMLLVNLFWGAGEVSLDQLFRRAPKQSLLE
ncbi:DoxX family protein [Photobacterium sp. MCCC 1A19761]|uniref:DoxX family protein n=1 Tax=Photobacterium sp. MCCC 1A19761 TaxID=3115000 RepID=UPI00307D50F8